jgi:hypothetical protein
MTWIQTKRAFLSVVAYDPSNDREPNSPFKAFTDNKHTHVLVRARLEEHIKDLETVVPNLTWQSQPTADYRFRAVIKREQWADYLMRTIEEMDYYSHYKEVVRDAHPAHLRSAIYSTMMSIWGKYASMQPSKPYSGKHTAKAIAPKSSFKNGKNGETVDEWLDRRAREAEKQNGKPKSPSDVDKLIESLQSDEPPQPTWNLAKMADKLKAVIKAGEGVASLPTAITTDTTDDAFDLYVRVLEDEEATDAAGQVLTEADVDRVIQDLQVEAGVAALPPEAL